ncbi:acyl-CoA dehydrogenase family protein [Streptosporangium saharense]|uniref:Alkylation response protein AidB-like acyl-CoA dehydrogenase n=1 Tax=Streptosporangium saharense TaxID=1706840 RepID=A0A7W7QSG3_9ACTN|nr:acyl-CoA dehydrogenase family protein [Streptosporangium saharense]MBB4918858.1 alkylation response protein AidB-like acyl-CoA dehydrogenase [Streptosporangium saharense]
MEITEAPSREELVRRASELVPLLQKNALWAEENRRLPEESIEALTEAGILKMRVPTRYGGHESDMGTVVEVLAELARGDGSHSWTVAVWAISTWMVGLFPDEVQDEVFSTPDVRVSGILSPTAVAVPVDGGVVLNGKWSFNTGSQQSHWNTNAAVLATGDGGYEPIMVAIPLPDLRVIDDWYTSGLRGSGSVTTVAQDLFIPQQRVLSMGPVLQGRISSKLNANSPIFRAPFMPTACTTVGATALGLAKAARDAFFERLPGRKISYTAYDSQKDAPLTHLQVAEAVTKIDEAEFHAFRAASLVDTKGPTGEPWTLEERARIRLDLGAVCQRAKEAVDILNTASGGSSIYSSVPIQRIERDVQTLNLHAIMHPNTNLELYGRILCGLEPNTVYL